MISPITDKVIKQLKKSNLTTEDRSALVSALLDKLGAFPIGDVIDVNEKGLTVNGVDLDQDQQYAFKEACAGLKDNYARKILNEQLRYKATVTGIHKSNTIDELLFAKAVIWLINEEEILLARLSTI